MSGKTRDRERVTEAFRRWARAGCPEPDQIRTEMVGHEVAEDFRACAAVFGALEKDMRSNGVGPHAVRAVRQVYMAQPFRALRKCEISLRVRAVAREEYASERQVYAWIAKTRSLWFRFRG